MLITNIRIVQRENHTALIGDCCANGERKELFYAVEKKDGAHLDEHSADAFVLASLVPAMCAGEDLIVDWPISEQLKYNLETYLVPWLVKADATLYPSRIIAKQGFTAYHYDGNGIATGISCGVDSFYTVLKTLSTETPEALRLTHTVLNRHVEATSFAAAKQLAITENDRERMKVGRQLGTESIYVWTNAKQYIDLPFEMVSTFHDLSVALSLKKLLKHYYYASSDPLTNFRLTFDYSQDYDLLNAFAIRTESFQMHSHAVHEDRIEKTDFIAGYPIVHQNLHVCFHQEYHGSYRNCTKCEKCIRTATALDILGRLSHFSETFDLEYFTRNRARIYGEVRYRAHINQNYFDRVILETAKKRHVRIPTASRFWMLHLGIQRQWSKLWN